MGHSFLLVTAVMFAGQVEGGPIEVYEQPGPGQQWYTGQKGPGLRDRVRTWFAPPPDYSEYGAQSHPGFLGRVRGWFGRSEPTAVEHGEPVEINNGPFEPVTITNSPTNNAAVIQTSAEPPLGDKKAAKAAPVKKANFVVTSVPEKAPLQQADFRPAAPVKVQNNGAIAAKFVNKIGHEDDYSWITGQLVRSGNSWEVHYATPETQDVYQGRLFILPVIDMNQVHDGDLVCVQGRVVSADRGTVYRPTAIFLIERK